MFARVMGLLACRFHRSKLSYYEKSACEYFDYELNLSGL
jgi:hypothetical protein